jgi:hypothetical protein
VRGRRYHPRHNTTNTTTTTINNNNNSTNSNNSNTRPQPTPPLRLQGGSIGSFLGASTAGQNSKYKMQDVYTRGQKPREGYQEIQMGAAVPADPDEALRLRRAAVLEQHRQVKEATQANGAQANAAGFQGGKSY